MNGTSPGPLIEVTQGDLLEVRLRNADVPGRDDPALARARRAERGGRRRRGHPGRRRGRRGAHLPVRRQASAAPTGTTRTRSPTSRCIGGLLGALVVRPRGPDRSVRDVVAVAHTYDGIPHPQRRRAPCGCRRGRDSGSASAWSTPTTARRRRGRARRTGWSPSTARTCTGRPTSTAGRSWSPPAAASTSRWWRPPTAARCGSRSARRRRSWSAGPASRPPRPPADADPRPAVLRVAGAARPRPGRRGPALRLRHRPRPGLRAGQAGDLVDASTATSSPTCRCTSSTRATWSGCGSPTAAARCTRCTCTATTPSCSRRNGVQATGSPWWFDSLNVLDGETYDVAFVADNPGHLDGPLPQPEARAAGPARAPDVRRRDRALPARAPTRATSRSTTAGIDPCPPGWYS